MEFNILKDIIISLGGLAIFIYGMNLMSDGLQKTAGEKMKKLLALLTQNPLLGVLMGTLTTAVLQSSSATTIMVIGFVGAGLMNLPQAISVVLGANIGTTITAQIVAFKLGNYAWVLVLAGFILYYFLKKEAVMNFGQAIFGFGLLFVGMNTMSEAMESIAASVQTAELLAHINQIPVLGVLIGTLFAAVLQSSSATIAVLQNLASQAGPDGVTSVIGLAGAIPLLLGANIGTTISAALASKKASVNAKRTAAAHFIFNAVGTVLFLFFIPEFMKLIQAISPDGAEVDILSREIANAHMCFNIINTLIFLPFLWLLVKAVIKLIPGNDCERHISEPLYLDYNIIEQPVFAIHMATKELSRIANLTSQMLTNAKKAFLGNDKEAVHAVFETENIVNKLQDETVKYLATIFATDTLTEHQGAMVSGLIHTASDIEHIGDHCNNIAEFSNEKIKYGYEFSDSACAEIYECFDHVARMVRDSIKALENGDILLAKDVLIQEEQMNRMEERLKKEHIKRLYEKVCSPEFTVMYTDIIHNIEKIGDCCQNVAEAVLNDVNFKESNLQSKEL
ncbi:Na/Pi cotransporter family protein [Clostridium aminobutyricum]|uniref:Na/Pi cotransporter family protein n=1 Tax=Clostridium aminobutyricum TaxID=33953 RepID=A0A939D8J7_CLOAM|nr:Na/Pi cotransporter family protein [Clostridium aminobutyricum]MBN7772683.1 Na/Pi cotransporter family protein [Clostridium aminobutyricum]